MTTEDFEALYSTLRIWRDAADLNITMADKFGITAAYWYNMGIRDVAKSLEKDLSDMEDEQCKEH